MRKLKSLIIFATCIHLSFSELSEKEGNFKKSFYSKSWQTFTLNFQNNNFRKVFIIFCGEISKFRMYHSRFRFVYNVKWSMYKKRWMRKQFRNSLWKLCFWVWSLLLLQVKWKYIKQKLQILIEIWNVLCCRVDSCGSTVSQNITYIQNADFPTGTTTASQTCQYTIAGNEGKLSI